MARKTLKGRTRSGPPFVQLFHYVLNSPGWMAAAPAERAIYVQLASLYNGHNNGSLFIAVRDAASLVHVNKDTAARSFNRLEELGLIERTALGSFQTKTRLAARYRLTCYRCDLTGDLPSKQFLNPTGIQNTVRKKG